MLAYSLLTWRQKSAKFAAKDSTGQAAIQTVSVLPNTIQPVSEVRSQTSSGHVTLSANVFSPALSA